MIHVSAGISALGFASGALAGLVVIPPAAAVVLPVGAFFLDDIRHRGSGQDMDSF